jgi:hypothetical protein
MPPSQEAQILNGAATNSQTTKALNGNVNGNSTTNGAPNGQNGVNGHEPVADDGPELANRLFVERSEKAFGSRAISLIDLPAGSLFAKITKATPSTKAYTSVQISENAHIELNSEIVFINHSCAPSVIFDMSRFEVRVSKERDLKKGDAITFFYPSSEWEMAQHFECTCGEGVCVGVVQGAGLMDEGVLRRYWLNGHIERLLAAKNGEKKEENRVTNGN